MNKWNKLRKTNLKSLGEAPTEASENIRASEPLLRDNRFTGRTKKVSFTCSPEFAEELRKLAYEENCYQIEVLEKALESYKRKKQTQQDKELERYVKVIERKKFSHPNETFTCDKCGTSFQNETVYAYSSRLGKKSKTYCGGCVK